MALGHKTDGPKAGTPNRKARAITELLESLGHNPIEAMVRIATNPKASLELRGRMNAELAQYVYPKRKAGEVAGDQDAPFVPRRVETHIVPTPEVPPECKYGLKLAVVWPRLEQVVSTRVAHLLNAIQRDFKPERAQRHHY